MKIKTLFLIIIALLCQACSANWPHRYDTLVPDISLQGPGNIIVLTEDRRGPVVSGELKPFMVGSVKSVYGDPWHMVTTGKKPFNKVFGSAVCNAFITRGFNCSVVEGIKFDDQEKMSRIAAQYQANYVLSFVIREWFAEVLTTTILNYDIGLNIFNYEGFSLATASISGQDRLSVKSILNPAKNASQRAPVALKQLIELILNDEKISRTIT